MSGGHEVMTWETFRQLEPARPAVAIARQDGSGDRGELRTPRGAGPHPVAVVVHGGCWSAIAGPAYMSHLAEALTELGWAAWSPAFLRADDPGGSWPGMLEDVGEALDDLRIFGAEHDLDLGRVVTIGHSSGGHLALWLAARAAIPPSGDGARLRGLDPLRVAAVVGLAPIADLRDFHARPDRGCPPSAVSDLLGGPPATVPGRSALVDPAALVPIGVPQLLITGALDATVPTSHVRGYARRAAAAGDSVVAIEVPSAGHFELVAPRHDTWVARTGPAIADFLAEVLAAG